MTVDYIIKIDKELEELLPPLFSEDYEALEQSLLENGFNNQFGNIKIWVPKEDEDSGVGYIVDGHNRYEICKKHNINIPAWCYDYMFFETKQDVMKWMYENQLARRNLSDVDKYEIVERYSALLKDMAKKNQSDGGKGLSNLTEVNVRKEKAEKVGISEGSYYKLDKVMKSENEDVKEKLRRKELSIDKAFRVIKQVNADAGAKQSEVVLTPKMQIEKIDSRTSDIDKEIAVLQSERKDLLLKRRLLFEGLEIKCPLQYEFIEEEDVWSFSHRRCRFYIEHEGQREVLVEIILPHKEPDEFWVGQIPEKYRNDFIMLWEKAYFEEAADYEKRQKKQEDCLRQLQVDDINKKKEFYKKCYRTLVKVVHPDNANNGETVEAMQYLNALKSMWKV